MLHSMQSAQFCNTNILHMHKNTLSNHRSIVYILVKRTAVGLVTREVKVYLIDSFLRVHRVHLVIDESRQTIDNLQRRYYQRQVRFLYPRVMRQFRNFTNSFTYMSRSITKSSIFQLIFQTRNTVYGSMIVGKLAPERSLLARSTPLIVNDLLNALLIHRISLILYDPSEIEAFNQ